MEKNKKVIIVVAIMIAMVAIVCFGGLNTRPGGHKIVSKDRVAVINVTGPIVGGNDDPLELGNANSTTSGSLMKKFRKARQDESVKAVLLRIDSPGGSAAATQEAAQELQRVKDAGKPIIVSMGDTAASGAYWLASYGDIIYANPSTITGSIGVYMGYYDLQGLSQKLGVSEEKIKSGPHKDIFSPFRPMTEEERQMTQTMVDDMYNQFVDVVAKGRHMDASQVRALADGRVYTGQQAKANGLVDEMGNYYDALGEAGRRIGASEDDVPTVEYNEGASLRQWLAGETSVSKILSTHFGSDSNVPLPLLLMKGVWQR